MLCQRPPFAPSGQLLQPVRIELTAAITHQEITRRDAAAPRQGQELLFLGMHSLPLALQLTEEFDSALGVQPQARHLASKGRGKLLHPRAVLLGNIPPTTCRRNSLGA